MRKAAICTAITLGGLLLLDIVATGLRNKYPVFHGIAIASYIFTGILLMALGLVGGYFAYLFQRLKNRGFGINPGRNFTDWISMILEENGVKSISDLERAAGQAPEGLHIRSSFIDPKVKHDPTKGLVPDITLITSDIITQNKNRIPAHVGPVQGYQRFPASGRVRAGIHEHSHLFRIAYYPRHPERPS